MTVEQYLSALRRLGIRADAGDALRADREAARLLRVDERTARRYRLGETAIPGPVEVALQCMLRAKRAPAGLL